MISPNYFEVSSYLPSLPLPILFHCQHAKCCQRHSRSKFLTNHNLKLLTNLLWWHNNNSVIASVALLCSQALCTQFPLMNTVNRLLPPLHCRVTSSSSGADDLSLLADVCDVCKCNFVTRCWQYEVNQQCILSMLVPIISLVYKSSHIFFVITHFLSLI